MRLQVQAGASQMAEQRVSFKLDRTAPVTTLPNLIDGIAWERGTHLQGTVQDDSTAVAVSYQLESMAGTLLGVAQTVTVTGNAFDQVLDDATLQTETPYQLLLTSTDRAGNTERSSFQFFIPSERRVTDDDTLPGQPPNPVDPNPPTTSPTAGNVNSWGSVGRGGGWGYWSYTGGGAAGGTFTSFPGVGFDPAHPEAKAALAGMSGSGYEYDYDESVSQLVTKAVSLISTDPDTITKKAALLHRQDILRAIGTRLETLIQADANFRNDQALIDRLRPAMEGLFADAYAPVGNEAGVEQGFVLPGGAWLAQALVSDPLSVRVQVFQATLLEVVTEATLGVTNVTQQQALAAAVLELAKTYAWLNPNPEAAVPVADKDFGFLDSLWRLQIPAANGQFKGSGAIAQTLTESIAALGRLLEGVQDPVRAIQFLNNLVQAASNVTSLNTDVKDAQFLKRLIAFGLEVAKLNPTTVTSALSNESVSFLNVLWQDGDMQQSWGGLGDFFRDVENPTDLINSEYKLLTVLRGADIPEQKELLRDFSYINGIVELGSYYPRTRPSTEQQDDFFYDVWRAETGEELQTIAAGLNAEDISNPFAVASGTRYSSNLNGPLAGVNGYWVPSTATLFEMEDISREAFFWSMLNPRRSSPITTVYLDVLAPKGATVHRNKWGDNQDFTGDIITNIVENEGFSKGYDDVVSEFATAAKKLNVGLDKIHLSAWIEGSGLVSAKVERTRGGKRAGKDVVGNLYTNELYSFAKDIDGNGKFDGGGLFFDNEAELMNSKSFKNSGTTYVDLLNDKVYERLKRFILDVANRDEVDEIMLDDHFGILEDYNAKAIARYGSLDQVRQRITDRLRDLKNTLPAGKTLSISVNPFNFTDGGSAKKINNQDVAAWIEQGLLKGTTLNVQIYRPTLDAFKETYDELKRSVSQHLSDKRVVLGEEAFKNYLNAFPKISISIAQTGGGWALPLEALQAQANYINTDKISNRPNNEIFNFSSGGYSKSVIASVVGFDFHRFENLKNGTIKVESGKNVPTGNGTPWGTP